MGKIFAIGGGEFKTRKIKVFDDYLSSLVKSYIVYIPADFNADSYSSFRNIYLHEYGVDVKTISIDMSLDEMKGIILNASLIYVGGGNTKKMLTIWKNIGLDKVLIQAYQNDILLGGISAGAICWFNKAYTDSSAYSYMGEIKNLDLIDGLGLIKMCCCPHYNDEGRIFFNDLINQGIALEDNTMIVIEEDNYEVFRLGTNSVFYIDHNLTPFLVELKSKGSFSKMKECI